MNYHGPDQLGETISRWSRYTLDALLNYDKTFNQDHHFKAMVGYKIGSMIIGIYTLSASFRIVK